MRRCHGRLKSGKTLPRLGTKHIDWRWDRTAPAGRGSPVRSQKGSPNERRFLHIFVSFPGWLPTSLPAVRFYGISVNSALRSLKRR